MSYCEISLLKKRLLMEIRIRIVSLRLWHTHTHTHTQKRQSCKIYELAKIECETIYFYKEKNNTAENLTVSNDKDMLCFLSSFSLSFSLLILLAHLFNFSLLFL